MTTVFLNNAKTKCCYTSKHRNPLRKPRKELDCSYYKVAYHPYTGEYVAVDTCPKKPFNTIYKDNYAVSCTSCDPSVNAVCYNPVIRKIQNRNGYINDRYNYSAKQYLQRRCRTYKQKVFNFTSNVAAFSMTKKWLTDGLAPSLSSSPVLSLDGKRVYVGTKYDQLYAIDATNGAEIWTGGGGGGWTTPALSPDGSVLLTGGGGAPLGPINLYAINAKTGAEIWTFVAGGQVNAPILSPDGDVVFMSSQDGNLYAINAATGAQIWNVFSGSPTYSSPALSPGGDVVFVGVGAGLCAINAATGSTPAIWCFLAAGQVNSPTISADGRVVFVGAWDNKLYAIDAATGAEIWSYPTQYMGIYASPTLSPDGSVDDNNLYAINTTDGTKKWSYKTGGVIESPAALSPDGKVVYVGSWDYNLYAIDAQTGKKLASYKTGGQVRSSPAISSDGKVVYVGSDDGNFYAFDVGGDWCCSNTYSTTCQGTPVIAGKDECIVNCDRCETVACRGYSSCEPKSADCCAVYKRSNGPHRRQGAVSGGSRINRLKYQTILQSQSTYKVPNPSNRPANPKENAYGSFNSGGNVNAVNGEMPVSLYRNTGPTYKRNLGGFCGNTVKPPALISTGACRMKGTLCCFK